MTDVGKISIRVFPNTDGFRQATKRQVEQAVSGLRVKVKVDPDAKGFAKDVNKAATQAAKAASGKKVKFDSELDSAGLSAKAKAAAQAASGHKISFRALALGAFDRISRQVLRVSEGLRRVSRSARDLRTVTKSFNLFGRSVRKATTPVRTLGKALLALPGKSGLLRAYADDLNSYVFKPTAQRFDALQKKLSRPLRMRFDKSSPIAEMAAIRRAVELEASRIQATQKSKGEPNRVLRKALKDMHKAAASVDWDGDWETQVRQLQKDMGEIRRKIGDGSEAAAEFDRNLSRAFTRLRDGDVTRFQKAVKEIRFQTREFGDTLRHSKVGQSFAKDLQAARIQTEKLRNAARKIKDDFRSSPLGQQTEHALARMEGSLYAVRNRMREIGKSDAWDKVSKGAERSARNIRNMFRSQGDVWKAPTGQSSGGIAGIEKDAKKANRGLGGMIANLGKLRKAFGRTGQSSDGFFKKFRQAYFQPDSTIGFVVAAIVAAIAPLSGLIGSLLAGLPTLLASVGAAAAVVALGFDGIKDAVEPLSAALEPLKESLSGIFREELTPQFEKLASIIPALAPGLEGVARGMTAFTSAFVDAATAPENVALINTLLERTSALFESMGPGIASFTDGFATMFEGASRGFPAMAAVFNDFAELFKADMSRLVDTGQMQAAMESLATVTGSLFENLHKIFVAGIENMPKMTEGFQALFDGIGDGLVAAMPALAEFSNNVGVAIGAIIEGLGEMLGAIAPNMARAFESIGEIGGSFIEHMGPALVEAAGRISNSLANVFEALEAPMSRIMPQLAESFTGLVDGIADVIDHMADTGVLEEFANALSNLATNGMDAFLQAVQGIAPLLPGLVNSFVELMTALGEGSAEALVQLATDGIPVLIEGLEVLIPLLQELVDLLNAIPIDAIAGGTENMVKSAFGPLGFAIDAGKNIKDFFTGAGDSAEEAAPKVADFSTQVSGLNTAMLESGNNKPQWGPTVEQATTEAMAPLSQFQAALRDNVGGSVDEVNTKLWTLGPTAAAAASEAVSGVQIGMGSLGSVMSSVANVAVSDVSSSLAPLPGIASSAGNEAVASASSSLAPLPGIVQGAADEMTSSADTGMSQMNSAFQSGVDQAGQTASTLVPTVKGAIGDTNALYSSGLALGNSFAQGIRASIPAAAAAAAELAGAVKANMPNSPAKEGPLSGKGYTDESGKALARDFAGGISSEVSTVSDAARDIAAAAKAGVERYHKEIDKYNHDLVYVPAMESNAKKIADYHKREAEALERGNDDAEKALERRNKLLESLEVPDFREINRSIQSYYIDGTKGMFNQALLKHANDTKFSAQLRDVALQAVREAKEVFGDHPVMAQVEANVNAEHFQWSIEEAIKAADLGAVPIDFAISNLDQLKSDLGFGNGALTRGFQALLDFNPNETDAYRYEKGKEEVHYHVTDLEEAMRLEDERRRRGALRYI